MKCVKFINEVCERKLGSPKSEMQCGRVRGRRIKRKGGGVSFTLTVRSLGERKFGLGRCDERGRRLQTK